MAEPEEVVDVEATLDGLDSPSSTDVVLATMAHSERSIAALAAKRASGAGSGSVPYVTVQSGDPTDFVTPLVSADSGLYAWDGAAYQLVADAPA